jgi:hypothetical protein
LFKFATHQKSYTTLKKLTTLLILFIGLTSFAQNTSITGILVEDSGDPIMFANILLYNTQDSALVKVETSDATGKFAFQEIKKGDYYLVSSYVGYEDLRINDVNTSEKSKIDLGQQTLNVSSVQLEAAVVVAQRSLVEVKADRTVFNVEGTVNSAGDNALGLLKKAPGVMVDNNNNVSVLSRTGVIFYLDGKRLPLSGDDLNNYLQNIPAEQIDRIDIISNPGAKYEAEGNAGIIDIRLKRDKKLGYNGTVNGTFSQGLHSRGNGGISGNYRNKTLNTFASINLNKGERYNEMFFENRQNGLLLDEVNKSVNSNQNINLRLGTDFFITKNSTVGFMINSGFGEADNINRNTSEISNNDPTNIDSVLIANNMTDNTNSQNTFNLNYVWGVNQTKLNIDFDYGRYRNESYFIQPNRYYNADRETLRSEVLTEYDTPTNIDIYTFKMDYEKPVLGGQLGFGTKLSKVSTENTFLFYDINDGIKTLNNSRSNDFDYDENVYAGYVNYARPVNRKVNINAGVRVEQTDATGDLRAFDPDQAEPPVDLNYINFFPSVGLTYANNPMHMWSMNYGRRINRPDYNVLNPFRIQMSELSFSKGNARLNPEIVNNIELGYTYKYMYNFKLGYSKTLDQITRLIGPDDEDPRAGFISWENLATQTIYSANISAPFQVNSWWSLFVNAGAGYQDNRANYGEEGMVDVQAFNYTFFQQSTFKLPYKLQAEISGWYSGPGIWGGVFKYDPSYSLNLGIQRKFLNDQMNVKLNVNDITYQSGWSGVSNFNGLEGTGRGNFDSRRVTLSISYGFGNNNVKSRKRKTGIEEESKRVGGN